MQDIDHPHRRKKQHYDHAYVLYLVFDHALRRASTYLETGFDYDRAVVDDGVLLLDVDQSHLQIQPGQMNKNGFQRLVGGYSQVGLMVHHDNLLYTVVEDVELTLIEVALKTMLIFGGTVYAHDDDDGGGDDDLLNATFGDVGNLVVEDDDFFVQHRETMGSLGRKVNGQADLLCCVLGLHQNEPKGSLLPSLRHENLHLTDQLGVYYDVSYEQGQDFLDRDNCC